MNTIVEFYSRGYVYWGCFTYLIASVVWLLYRMFITGETTSFCPWGVLGWILGLAASWVGAIIIFIAFCYTEGEEFFEMLGNWMENDLFTIPSGKKTRR